ncbi:MAG: CotH kinase family protein [Chloroflexi bacterium]|nr:CotH kinase family protein [Chloroflexota bacterium]
MKKIKLALNSLLVTVFILSACSVPVSANLSREINVNPEDDQAASELASEENSSSEKIQDEADYGIVFPQDSVNEITISISPENWQIMLGDMTDLYGEPGIGNQPGGRPGPEAGNVERPALPGGEGGKQPPDNIPMGGGMGLMGGDDDKNPVWVEAEVSFNGEIWEHIGIRYKGNSSLKSTWGSGSLKLPFKLDFDQYEDQYTETEDQRFFGFKQLSFSSGFHDDSRLREKITADLFREAGVPSAQTAFYAVNIDNGEGPVYFGLYTVVEVVDDTLIETQFSDDSGNVYKPEGKGATFAAGTFTETSFDKETNQDEGDYSDILALFDILNDESRIKDPENWRHELEAVFDVDTFLNWLAVNTVIRNWDTYGVTNHNYYLYNNPETGQLVWIPWDNNESLKSAGGMRNSLDLDLNNMEGSWPLISYLRDDPLYYQKYLSYLDKFLTEVFVLEDLADTYQNYHELITPYVLAESEEYTQLSHPGAYNQSVSELIQHTRDRIQTAEYFLSIQ